MHTSFTFWATAVTCYGPCCYKSNMHQLTVGFHEQWIQFVVFVSLQLNPDDPELKLMSDTLHLSGPALRHEPRQLASQIVGRLQGVITLDTPKTAGDPRKYPNLHKLLDSARETSIPVSLNANRNYFLVSNVG